MGVVSCGTVCTGRCANGTSAAKFPYQTCYVGCWMLYSNRAGLMLMGVGLRLQCWQCELSNLCLNISLASFNSRQHSLV